MSNDKDNVVFRTFGMHVVRPPWPTTLSVGAEYAIDAPEARQAL